MSGFTVKVTREDGLWVAVATAADGARVGALDFLDFDDVHDTMPDYIADMTDLDPDDVAVDWRYEINGRDVTVEIRQLRSASEEQQKAQATADRARADALEAMLTAGRPQRIMAGVVRLSPPASQPAGQRQGPRQTQVEQLRPSRLVNRLPGVLDADEMELRVGPALSVVVAEVDHGAA